MIAAGVPLIAGQTATNTLPEGTTSYETVKVADGIFGFIPLEDDTAFV